MEATNNCGIAEAKTYLEHKSYVVSSHKNGHLIVQKPVRVAGCDGRLITCGSKPIVIRNFAEAIRFSCKDK